MTSLDSHTVWSVTLSNIDSVGRSLGARTQGNGRNSSLHIDLLSSGSDSSSTPVHTNGNVTNQALCESLSKQLRGNNGIVSIGVGSGVQRILRVESAVQGSQVSMVRSQLVDRVD